MKTLKKQSIVTALALTLLLPALAFGQDAPPPQGPPPGDAPAPAAAPPMGDPGAQAPVTMQTFYDQLAPYGQWVNYPGYGYVFIPSVAPGFQPYSTGGHWVYNEQYGWTWASDYPWGWATFHYGRWNYNAGYGWFWVPDLNWGPAWVAWRNCEGYYGWAPLPWGCNINVGFGDYGIAAERWCFVPQEHLCERNLFGFFVPRAHYAALIAHSVIINRMDYDNGHHFGYFKGPDRVEVEGYTHHPVEVVHVGAGYGYGRPNTVVVEHGGPVNRGGMEVRHDNVAHVNSVPQRAVELHSVPQRTASVVHSSSPQRNVSEHGGERR